MLKYSKTYKNYGFEKHMGYGTQKHTEALAKYNITEIHRKSFKPVKAYIK